MKTTLFRLLTGIAGLYHVLLGLAGLLLPTATFLKVSALILGIEPEMNPEMALIIKFASTYVLAFGILLLLLLKDPVKYRELAIPVLSLFGIRLLNKLIFFGSIGELFDVPVARNVFAVVCVAVFFFGILLTLPRANKSR